MRKKSQKINEKYLRTSLNYVLGLVMKRKYIRINRKGKMLIEKDIIKKLIEILNLYENKTPLISNQGQVLDGYSALAEFINIAKEARENAKKKTNTKGKKATV
jgi:hypothetical protein